MILEVCVFFFRFEAGGGGWVSRHDDEGQHIRHRTTTCLYFVLSVYAFFFSFFCSQCQLKKNFPYSETKGTLCREQKDEKVNFCQTVGLWKQCWFFFFVVGEIVWGE